MAAAAAVHASFGVFIQADAVVLDAGSDDDTTCLSIRRPDGACALVPRPARGWGDGRPADLDAVAIVGSLAMASGHYLMLVTNRRRAARAPGYEIWQATAFELIPLGAPHVLARRARREEAELVAAVRETVLNCRALYLSYAHDLTHTAQRIATRVARHLPLWQRAEPRFFFNRAACDELIAARCDRWIVPLVQGYVHHHEGVLNGRAFDVLTIARRSARRAGVRFHQRGLGGCAGGGGGGGACADASESCEVAHLCESEQVLLCDGVLSAHTQLRGSIPLAWSQPPGLLVSDPHRGVVLVEGRAGSDQCALHVASLLDDYGPELTIVSLINQAKGAEVALGQALDRELTRLSDGCVRYVPWDFHRQCARGNYAEVAGGLLHDHLNDDLARHGAFEQAQQDTQDEHAQQARADAHAHARGRAVGGGGEGGASDELQRTLSHGALALAAHAASQQTAARRGRGSSAGATPPSRTPPTRDAATAPAAEAAAAPTAAARAAAAVGRLPEWTMTTAAAAVRDGCARGRVRAVQCGVLRTNCIDCQDRTNVVQAEVAHCVLEAQLRRAGVLLTHESVDLHKVFHNARRCVWADHGDVHSRLYSGTPAVKGDFVRTGARTLCGVLSDVANSAARFYVNNLADGLRQDAYDAFLRKWTPPSPLPATAALFAGPPRIGLLAYVARCVALSLVLRVVLGSSAAQVCEGAARSQQPHARLLGSACDFGATELSDGGWQLGQVVCVIAYLRWCVRSVLTRIDRFVSLPRLLPKEYEPPLKGAVLGSLGKY